MFDPITITATIATVGSILVKLISNIIEYRRNSEDKKITIRLTKKNGEQVIIEPENLDKKELRKVIENILENENS